MIAFSEQSNLFPHFFYFTNLFLHLGLGVVVAALFLPWWWSRRRQALPFVSGLLLVASALVAVVLLAVGNERHTYFLVWIHVGLAIAGLVGLVIHGFRRRAGNLPKLAAVGLALAPRLAALLGAGLPLTRFPLERAGEAHDAVEAGTVGKVLIDVTEA